MPLGKRFTLASLVLFGALVACSSDDGEEEGDACSEPDQDGIIGGDAPFEVTVSDVDFAPKVLKAQNSANVTLKVTNAGTKPHGFRIECLVDGQCRACFPEAANLAPIAPGGSTSVQFVAPMVEGIYTIVSDGDPFTAQFILQ